MKDELKANGQFQNRNSAVVVALNALPRTNICSVVRSPTRKLNVSRRPKQRQAAVSQNSRADAPRKLVLHPV